MDRITLNALQGAAGAGGGDKVYAEEVFSTYLYDGLGTGAMPINNGIDLSGEGGMVWVKNRGIAWDHWIMDSERGVNLHLYANNDYPEPASSANSGINSFDDDGFTLGNASAGVNSANPGYCSWTFRKAPGFFDIVTWDGNGVDPRTINHNLGSIPGMIIVKRTDSADDWIVYHKDVTTGYLKLNENSVIQTRTDYIYQNPTNTTFRVGGFGPINATGGSYVAYLFADGDDADAQIFGDGGDESIIKCGTFGGTGTLTNVGFEPQWLLVKSTNNTEDWHIYDNMRGMAGPEASQGGAQYVKVNTSDAEAGGYGISFESNGFYNNTWGSSHTMAYVAIRRGPMKTPEDATKVFAVDISNTSATIPAFDSGFPVDMAIVRATSSGANNMITARLTGESFLVTNTTSVENSSSDWEATYTVKDSNLGFGVSYASNIYSWMFKRAPGFFDVVAYTGDDVNSRNIPHNLTVAPELMFLKVRDVVDDWLVWNQSGGVTGILRLNDVAGGATYTSSIPTNPTSSNIVVSSNVKANQNNKTYIAYLFASCPGVSKVGTYDGTGNDINVDCGFTNGARFVMVKRIDDSGSWYIWDSVRGIVSGNDPYIRLDGTWVETTNTDYIDPLDAGFTITSNASGDADINSSASGSKYLYLAIA